jgi:hypothetical protein
VTTAVDPNLGLRRIIVASPPKSGSTYVANVIAEYFGAFILVSDQQFDGDHNITHFLADELRGRPCCFNFHMLPYTMNLLLAREERILLLAVWRNIGDMLLSIDEHALRQGGNGPAFYTSDLEYYRALPQEQRHLIRLDIMLSWYLRFYLMWRATNLALHPYEQMLIEKKPFFERILEPIVGQIDDAKLNESLAGRPAGNANRLNVGQAGRSAEQLSDTVKRELEARILRHPDVAQLEILLWELPWSVPALEMQHQLDGQVITASGTDEAHFVSRGRRYPISRPTWLESRTGERRTPKIVDARELEGLPSGAPLF